MLTATPMQNSLRDFYGLLSFIRGESSDAALSLLCGIPDDDQGSSEALKTLTQLTCKRHLRRDVQAAGHVAFTERVAVTFDFEPNERETALYDAVSTYLADYSIAFPGDSDLMAMVGRKILGSSVAAIEGFLSTVIGRLESYKAVDLETITDDGNATNPRETTARWSASGSLRLDTIDPAVLKAEIASLKSYRHLAAAIKHPAKGERLVAGLAAVLDSVVARGGKRKAVIFTESVRTQKYLAGLLSANGYAGQLVLLNGGNTDAESRAIYDDWCARRGPAASASRAADMKQALIDRFKSDDKIILIATESGAEGINLQFCSLVINFDLPWNPQRIEQRIGRCHRYGQRIDVTVVNMLNRKNATEQRIYDLLSDKFQLFESHFGVSDEVLGAVESGLDFEQLVLQAVQRGRSDEEVATAFRKLELLLDKKISADRADARSKLFHELDSDVLARLNGREAHVAASLDVYQRRLLTLVKAEVPAATFQLDSPSRFECDGTSYSTDARVAESEDCRLFRLSDCELARRMLDSAKARSLSPARMIFDYRAYRAAGNGRLFDVEALIGKSGWAQVDLVHFEAANQGACREQIVASGLCDDGVQINGDLIDRLMLLPVAASPSTVDDVPTRLIADCQLAALSSHAAEQRARSGRWVDDEKRVSSALGLQMERYANKQLRAFKRDIDAVEAALLDLAGLSPRPMEAEQAKLSQMKAKYAKLYNALQGELLDARAEAQQRADQQAHQLQFKTAVVPLMTIRWEVAGPADAEREAAAA